jgi:uroporphyrinogen-III synthase
MTARTSDEKPLTGLRVLVGRPRHQASALSTGLKKLGAEIIEIPFIEIRKPRSYKQLDTALKQVQEYDWLILTSVNGVEALADRLQQSRLPLSKLKHLKIAAIGPATREQIQKLGLRVAVVPKRYVAEAVVESLREKVQGKRILLARARVARDVIPSELRKMGARVDVVEAYETVVPESSRRQLKKLMRERNTRPQVVTFTSSSAARNFVQLLGGQECPPNTDLDGIRFASIGPITSATLREVGLSVHIEAEEFTIPGLIRAVEKLMR